MCKISLQKSKRLPKMENFVTRITAFLAASPWFLQNHWKNCIDAAKLLDRNNSQAYSVGQNGAGCPFYFGDEK